MTREVVTTATQALRGTPVATGGKTQCTDCHRTVREGDAVAVDAIRPADAEQFQPARVYCRHCRGESLPHRTAEARQLRVYARLGVTTDSASRDAQLTLRDPEPVAPAASEEDAD